MEVRQSSILGAGDGLFTTIPIKKGTIIDDYTLNTQKLSKEQFLARYPNKKTTHTLYVKGAYYDGLNTNAKIAKANRAPTGKRNNSRFNAVGKVIATADIAANTEIFLAYGPSFRI